MHESLGEFCGISKSLMHEVNRFIDLRLDHDKGRLIVYGRWDPKEKKGILHIGATRSKKGLSKRVRDPWISVQMAHAHIGRKRYLHNFDTSPHIF